MREYLGVVDATVVTVTEDHPSVDHGREVCWHCAPNIALHVDELQKLRVLKNTAKTTYISLAQALSNKLKFKH